MSDTNNIKIDFGRIFKACGMSMFSSYEPVVHIFNGLLELKMHCEETGNNEWWKGIQNLSPNEQIKELENVLRSPEFANRFFMAESDGLFRDYSYLPQIYGQKGSLGKIMAEVDRLFGDATNNNRLAVYNKFVKGCSEYACRSAGGYPQLEPEVVNFVAQLVDLKPGESICDPTATYGELISASIAYTQANKESQKAPLPGRVHVFGADSFSVSVNRMRLSLAKVPAITISNIRLALQDSQDRIQKQNIDYGNYDVVVTNLLFQKDKGYSSSEKAYFTKNRPPNSSLSSAAADLGEVINSLRPGGRLVAVVPVEFLHESSKSNKYLRSQGTINTACLLQVKSMDGSGISANAVIVFERGVPNDGSTQPIAPYTHTIHRQ